MFSNEVLTLLFIALILASPVSWFLMRDWLQNFAFRVQLSILYFLAAGFCAIAVALLTTSFLTIRAARANPVESLRYE